MTSRFPKSAGHKNRRQLSRKQNVTCQYAYIHIASPRYPGVAPALKEFLVQVSSSLIVENFKTNARIAEIFRTTCRI